ncbi:MAG: DUF1080 domain-containing protein [Acidobacteria bacterium]|nr:MAG: DUF1080 domain-containing protein [Acidobacteriota bacterium]
MRQAKALIGLLVVLAWPSVAPADAAAKKKAAAPAKASAPAAGWRALFDGKDTSAWRGYKSQDLPPEWKVVDGVLTKEGKSNDIVTKDQFGDWSAPEMQVLDDAGHPDGQSRLTAAGSDYGLYPSPAGVVKPAGQWNAVRLVVNGNHVEHWLNGVKVVEYELGSPDWEAKVKASKFKDWPNYGRAKKGVIAIQGDHEGTLEMKNIRIRELS